MNNSQKQAFLEAVQYNCSIADAASAGDYTLCIYLMKMRDYYLWHNNLEFSNTIDSEPLGSWIRRTESYWESLENKDFSPLPTPHKQLDPFETDEINKVLNPLQWVYSAGIGQHGKAHFFLATLEKAITYSSYKILISGHEFARDLVSPVAMTIDNTIFLRQQAIERLIWEKSQEIGWNKSETALSRSLADWNFEESPRKSLIEAATTFQPVFINHEIGEVMVGKHLGSQWEDLLAANFSSKLEYQLRALRDTLADLLSTLPQLLLKSDIRLVHFYFGMLSPLRKSMFPQLVRAYDKWEQTGNMDSLESTIHKLVPGCIELCESLLEAFNSSGKNHRNHLSAILESQLAKL